MKQVLEELFVVVYHGHVGSMRDAERLPIWKRRWWFHRVEKQHADDDAARQAAMKGGR